MSSVWVCVPSARPPAEVEKWAQAWRDMGYGVMLWVDTHADALAKEPSDPRPPTGRAIAAMYNARVGLYPGYAQATNELIRGVMKDSPDAQWFVIGGDDVYPDTTRRADEIAAECESHFGHRYLDAIDRLGFVPPSHSLAITQTFGVMQPTGDRWHEGRGGFHNAPIDRVAGSAWIGREFALRTYGGNGPLWPGYFHNFVDEELQCVAEKLGVFWQRRDLTQKHLNWARGETDQELVDAERMPEFLERANSPEEWDAAKRMFNERKQRGFPGHEVKA